MQITQAKLRGGFPLPGICLTNCRRASESVRRFLLLPDRRISASEHQGVLDEAVEALDDIAADDLIAVQVLLLDEDVGWTTCAFM